MVEAQNKHFYRFEPVQLKDFNIVIPIFFHTLKDKCVAKCYKPIIRSNTNHSQVEIHISFDDASLQTLWVDEFSQTYEEILLNNGIKLSNCCQNKIFEKKFTWIKCISVPFFFVGQKAHESFPPNFTKQCPNQLRTTEETSKNSEELWTYTKETLNPDKLDKKVAELAVRDQINLKFSRQTGEELPFHMIQDVPQELLDMEENELQRMFNAFLWLKGYIMLDYNQSSSLQNINYPFVKKLRVPDIDWIATLRDLQNSYPVNLIWKVQKPSHQSQFFINTTMFQKMGKNNFYKMGEIQRTPHSTFVNSLSVKAGLNAQHNCQHGECKLTATKIAIVERQESTRKTLELTHTNNEQYIVNLASLSSTSSHQTFSDIPADPPSPLQWSDALHDGLKKWGSTVAKKLHVQNRGL
ncbi:hypothetical protein MJO28_015700 [Puccinia striiformis f. sp. tritici]|uniref:Uncharacterized protein n=1 Tax=Puccinia striiformis f. sp. tritici TaxID=168172 RepID=A0ACC0DRE8_9BASI|nr:hypothetical protein MJO28_015700 [Puccinia striiformis f. sp. tritici]